MHVGWRVDQLQTAFIEFGNIREWNDPHAVTLTMRRRVGAELGSHYSYVRNLRFFLIRLNRIIFGSAAKRGLCRLNVIPVIEQDRSGRSHYHLAIDRPSHIERAEFERLIGEVWRDTHWGYDQICVKAGADPGWITYLGKRRSKVDFAAAIDWENFHNKN